MLQGLNAAAAGMAAQQARMDALAGDVANVSTTGYKRGRVAFRDLLYSPAGMGAAPGVQAGAGAAAMLAGRSMAEGALRETGRSLDVAIAGDGFLQVQAPGGGIALTRDGALGVDAQRRLVTSGGLLVQPPVTLPEGTDVDSIAIGPDGTVRAGERQLGRLQLVTVAAPERLAPAGESLLVATAESGGPQAAPDARLVQGSLEGSNVDLGTTMTEMIEAQRAYALAGRAIETQDRLLEIANAVKR